ncbi:DNA polymerase [Roseomonas sp. GC11]|uniref:DNA polymerase n=1 Tax=Roseomonas sp. GC11 TaxID=2950546 RepID=UPI00210B5F18|nr:DNA polymerase [Roseomonas sp. GC11]MCQ4158772.1 DNA polymerase [Roseomonas sp. GC11]
MRLIFDIETNGLLPTVSRLHSLVLRDADTGALVASCFASGPSLTEGLKLLSEAEEIIGHNVIKYDLPALQKLYPGWTWRGRVYDTLVAARLWMTGDVLRQADWDAAKDPKKSPFKAPEGKLTGSQSLKAWGQRLGVLKGDYGDATHNTKEGDAWAEWSPEMQEYCEQDTTVTLRLYQELQKANLSPRAVDLEHRFCWIIARQERRGFCFNEKAAGELHAKLMAEKVEAEAGLRKIFAPWWRLDGAPKMALVEPKRTMRRKTFFEATGLEHIVTYTAGSPYSKVTLHEFEPSSRQDFADRLMKLRGWKPKEFTPDGRPKVDEQVLGVLPYPEAKALARYLMLEKRIGQIATGKEAWLNHCRLGRIHGDVNTGGAHTGRCTHSRPNLAQVPSIRAPFGKECRALFCAGPGYELVGFDADALELRCLGHFMAPFDGGAFVRAVNAGSKEEGTDAHTLNAKALGLDPKKLYAIDGKKLSGRDIAKVWFYAFIYGAGNAKLGEILGVRGSEAQMVSAGKSARTRFLRNMPALAKLIEQVQAAVKTRGYIFGIDRRILRCRSANAALNTLLQSAGAVIMKQALICLDDMLQAEGMTPGEDYEFVANVHDEAQAEVRPALVEKFSALAIAALAKAGEDFTFRCPITGGASHGANWADTH